MTFGFAASVVNGWLDTAFAAAFIRLVVGDPGAAGTSNGAAGDTTRQGITMGAAAAGVKTMTGADPVWTNGGTSETITGVSLFTLAAGGTFIASGTLTTSQAWASGNTFTLTSLSASITPVAV
jgi:hypothetical protein